MMVDADLAAVEKAFARCCGADGVKARAVGRIVRDANKTNAVAMLVLAVFISSISMDIVFFVDCFGSLKHSFDLLPSLQESPKNGVAATRRGFRISDSTD